MERSNIKGLSSAEVESRLEAGLYNNVALTSTRSVSQIFKENLFTFFNILNLVFALIIISTGRIGNLAFLIVVIFNLVIGLVQEISAKKILDNLSVINAVKFKAVRDSKTVSVPVNRIVIDDVLVFTSGNQVCVDCEILSGHCEVNEAAISGETDLVFKVATEKLISGSYIVSGTVFAKVIAVGVNSFAGKVASDSRKIKEHSSSLMNSINVILKALSIVIIPFGVLVFIKGLLQSDMSLPDNINSTIALLISMVPEGLVLMTSLALVSCSVFLAYKRILVQNLYAVENLARTDILCMDKTGTITTGNMVVKNFLEIEDVKKETIFAINQLGDCNPTFNAVKSYYYSIADTLQSDMECLWSVDFKSENKFSCVSIAGFGRIFIGAPDVLLEFDDYRHIIDKYSIEIIGKRIIVVAYDDCFENSNIKNRECLKCAALLLIEEKIKKDADKTVEFFIEQGIEPVVITGDSYESVHTIIHSIGLKPHYYMNKDVYDSKAVKDSNVFCRTLPENKKQIVDAYQKTGKSVAMAGDGVNDVLALKKADSSISMGSGSDITRNISDIVLLDSDISVLPAAFNQGRRVINNIQRVSSLFLSKTIYSFIIALLILIVPGIVYPFNALQLTFLSFITIGFPAFFMSFEPDYSRVKDHFLRGVLIKSLPGSISVVFSFILINIFAYYYNIDMYSINTLAFIAFSVIGILNAMMISWPLTRLRLYVLLATVGILLCILLLPFTRGLLEICDLSDETEIFELIVCLLSTAVLFIIRKYSGKISTVLLRLLNNRALRRIFKQC